MLPASTRPAASCRRYDTPGERRINPATTACTATPPPSLTIGQGSAIQLLLAIAIIARLLLQFPLVLLAMPVLIGLTLSWPDRNTNAAKAARDVQ